MVRPGLTSRMVRTGLTEQAAAAFVQRHGSGAVTILRERAEMSEELGHRVAAKTWREMADAAVHLLPMAEPPTRSLPTAAGRWTAGGDILYKRASPAPR